LFREPLILKPSNLLAQVQKGRTLMYARVLFAQFRPEQTDEIIQLYRQAVVPEQGKQPGAKGTMVLIDRAAGKGISMTFWETEADLQASDEASPYYQALGAKFAPYWTTPQVREVYEVSIQE
jgi:heme-degrading monooxygenase HmoA